MDHRASLAAIVLATYLRIHSVIINMKQHKAFELVQIRNTTHASPTAFCPAFGRYLPRQTSMVLSDALALYVPIIPAQGR